MVYIETVNTSLGAEVVTSTEEEGEAFGPINDYEAYDTTTSNAPLALAVGAQDTGTSNGQDDTYVGIANEDGAKLAPMYDEESYRVPTYDSYEEEEGSTLIDDNSGQLDAVGKRPLTPYDLEVRLLVTRDQLTQVLTRTDGAHKFIEELVWRTHMEERHSGIAGGVTSAQLCIIREALEHLKSDYLQLFMDKELVLKFVEDKEREVDELHYQLGLAHYSPLMTDTPSYLEAVTQENVSLTHDVREETLMMSQDEEQSEMHVPEESDSLVCTLDWNCEDRDHFPLEKTLEAQGLAMEEMVEYIPCGPGRKEIYIYSDWLDIYMTYMDTIWDTG
jgi:hypothetical protein